MATARQPRVVKKPTRANPNRGEHEITLGGTTYVLRPSFAACSAIEAALGKSLIKLYQAANSLDMTYEEAGIAIGALIRAGAQDEMTKSVNDERIAELIYEGGFAAALVRLTFVFADAISGGRDVEGNVKAQPTA